MKLAWGTLIGLALGVGVGWVVFSWQPWESSGASEHDAEIAVIKQTGQTEANCERRQYPSNVFDCAAWRGDCPGGNYTVRASSSRFAVEERRGGPIVIPPVGC